MHEKIVKKFCNPILKKLEDNNCKIYGDNFIKKYDDTDNIICIQGIRNNSFIYDSDNRNKYFVKELGLLIITNLDIILLSEYYQIPIILLSTVKLSENNKTFLMTNKSDDENYYFILVLK